MNTTKDVWNSRIEVPFPLWLVATLALWAWAIVAIVAVTRWLT